MYNPWLKLSINPPYSLESDNEILKRNNLLAGTFSELRLEVLPVPFLGSLNLAKVVLLNLNPGFVDEDVEYNKDPNYVDQNRKSLTNKSDYPLFYLDPRFSYTAGYKWWYKRLNYFIKKFGIESVANLFMCVEYFPYHSKGFKRLREVLPSQEYSFYLVKEAIKQYKLIVIMRSKKLWLESVPELKNYPYIELKNPRSPYITSKNMNEADFNRLNMI